MMTIGTLKNRSTVDHIENQILNTKLLKNNTKLNTVNTSSDVTQVPDGFQS